MESILLAFIPLFVAIDVVGVLPFFVSLTERVSLKTKKKLTTEAVATALGISILFLFSGQLLFSFLGINENDFRIAGGILLLVLAIRDIAAPVPLVGLTTKMTEQEEDQSASLGVVPIGIPLMMGPAALTTILISAETHGTFSTLIALLLNLVIVWAVFRKSDMVLRVVGKPGSRAIAKVMALFLAAIGVMMIRLGMQEIWPR